jgi:hypothetical protein
MFKGKILLSGIFPLFVLTAQQELRPPVDFETMS